MLIFYKELTLDEGFRMLNVAREKRNIDGAKVSAPSGIALWQAYRSHGHAIKCWACDAVADRFVVKHHRNDCNKPPVVELYGKSEGKLVMMTQDHIIPKSLGGINVIANLRPACEPCNNSRKSKMDDNDTNFMNSNPHLRRFTV